MSNANKQLDAIFEKLFDGVSKRIQCEKEKLLSEIRQEMRQLRSRMSEVPTLFRPQLRKVKIRCVVEIPEGSNTLTPNAGVFGDTPV